MPIFRVNEKIVFFCHVPKCAGTAVNLYLQARFGKLAFIRDGYLADRDP
jgi:hypothetical protein